VFELTDHTADLGLHIVADSQEMLLAEAGAGLLAIQVANPQEVQPLHPVGIVLPRGDAEELLFDWLSELLYLFECDDWLFARFDVTLDERQLRAVAWGQRPGPSLQLDHEVKAITYHQLRVTQVEGRWEAELIVDI